MVLFGPLVWWIALMYGLMLLVKAFFNDFSKKGGDIFQFNEKSKEFRFKRKFSYKFRYVAANNVESINVRKWYRKLDFFDIFGISGLLIFLTLQQLEGWITADTPNLVLDNLISTSLWIVIIIIIVFYLCLPVDVVEIKTATITYRISITLKNKDKKLISKYMNNLKYFSKEILKPDMKNTFLARISVVILLIFGVLIYVAAYFVFIF